MLYFRKYPRGRPVLKPPSGPRLIIVGVLSPIQKQRLFSLAVYWSECLQIGQSEVVRLEAMTLLDTGEESCLMVAPS
jgi:hypothetical protein